MSTRILLAGGDYNFQQTVARMLKDEQIETVCAGDGRDALCLLNEIGPDLLIAECVLHGKNGYELCQYIREEPELQSLPIILLDNQFDAFNQNMANVVGADVYLSNPFAASELVGIVHRLLENGAETDNERSGSVGLVGMNQLSALSGLHGSVEPDVSNSERQPVTTYHLSDEQAVTTVSPAVLPEVRKGKSIMLWLILAGVLLAILGLAILDRKDTSINSAKQKQALISEVAKGDASIMDVQPSGKVLLEQGSANIMAEGAATPAGDGLLNAVSKVEDEKVVQTSPTDGSTGATGDRKAEKMQGESRQNSSTDLPRKDLSDASTGETSTRLTRPRSVSSIRPNTISSHFRRSGREMKQAGKHLGSGAKHFAQGGGKATVYAGKKVGQGAKRIGNAFKKIF
jgi:CheY-like chemotaxis protein